MIWFGQRGDQAVVRRAAEQFEAAADGIHARQQRFDIGDAGMAARQQVFDRGFQPVRHLAQAHRAGQPRTALEGVQRAHAGGRSRHLGGPPRPIAHARLQLRQQLFAFFAEDREQLFVDQVFGVDVFVIVQRIGACLDTRRIAWTIRKGGQRGLAQLDAEYRRGCRVGLGGRLGCARLAWQFHRPVIGQGIADGLGGGFGQQRLAQHRPGQRGGGGRAGRQLMRFQPLQQRGRHEPQEAGGKLVQQAADFFSGVDEQLRLPRCGAAGGDRAHQRVLEQARQRRQLHIADRGRAASQRMRQRGRAFAQRPIVFHRPFGQLDAQAARQLVGFVQVDVEQRNADAQIADDLDLLVVQRRRRNLQVQRQRLGNALRFGPGLGRVEQRQVDAGIDEGLGLRRRIQIEHQPRASVGRQLQRYQRRGTFRRRLVQIKAQLEQPGRGRRFGRLWHAQIELQIGSTGQTGHTLQQGR